MNPLSLIAVEIAGLAGSKWRSPGQGLAQNVSENNKQKDFGLARCCTCRDN
jgi:hypothetical protein